MRSKAIVVLSFILFLMFSGLVRGDIPQLERDALIALYNGTNGDSWTDNSGWKTEPLHTDGFAMPGTEKDWKGVICNDGDSMILEIDLRRNNLAGTIPLELGNLSNLAVLDLHSNQLTGSIPQELGNLSSLIDLYLNSNRLTGSIPSSFGSLTNLEKLYLNNNQLTGNIPSQLGNLSNLIQLYLHGNRLKGEIPIDIASLTNLIDNQSDFRWNALYIETGNEYLSSFLNSKQDGGDRESTQTIAPKDVSVRSIDSTTVEVRWTPITYTGDTGGYQVFYTTTSGGSYTLFATTEDKTVDRMEVTDLNEDTTYYFVVQTRTDPHGNNQNTVFSEYSDETFTTQGNMPTVTTKTVSDITSTSASSGGNVTDDGGEMVTARGVCWSTSENPTTADSTTSDGTGTGEFTSTITGLSPGTTYHVRAYATNIAGTAYGNDVSFTTTTTAPTVTTTGVSGITSTTASSGGNITSNGGAEVTARGVCWSTSENPTTADSTTSDGTGTGEFTSTITGLSPGTTYHVRAYATNSVDTSYGDDVSFTTTTTTPTVTTTGVSNITSTTALSSGNVTSDGGTTVIARGACWSTSPEPTTADSHTTDGTGTGEFTSPITGLTPDTTYYVRAYATNSVGTSYGSDMTFKTLPPSLPTVTTTTVSNMTCKTASSGGDVTDDGGDAITARGVCWSTSENPTTADSKTSDGTGTGEFTSSITGLNEGTLYHVRAYATNGIGTSYGSDVTFSTNTGCTTPTVTTIVVSNMTCKTASSGGNVTDDGGEAVTARGVCWSTSENPTTDDSTTLDGTGTGEFTSSITGLNEGTLYHVRAYATNGFGTSYGSDVTFSTNTGCTTPTVTTIVVSNMTCKTASSGGNVTDDGGEMVTARGVCWSTSENPSTADSTTSDGTGTGEFTSSITGLNEGTLYHARAYATNGFGTSYGSDVTFSTNTGCTTPTVITTTVSNMTCKTASGGGNVTDGGGEAVTARGVCWSTSENPTTDDSTTLDGTGTGEFTSSITGLSPGTTYYVRAYATNSAGTSYGSDVTFSTNLGCTTPTVTTTMVFNINSKTASSGGNVTDDGGEAVTARGVCWSTSENPTTDDSTTLDGTGTGEFTSSITGLSPGTTYYVRAYATNSVGTSYGSEESFTTPTTPIVTTTGVTNITSTTASSGGNVKDNGGAEVTARGVCWSTSENPTTVDSHTTDGTGTGEFTSSITGLTPDTTYYVRAYATNSAGTSYGDDVTFTTTTIPTVTTTEVSNVTSTTASCGGKVTDNGGAEVTARGVCWSTSPNPTIDDSHTMDGTGIGTFTSSITGLTPDTTYHIRAYATNSVGTSYGKDVSFTTTIEIGFPTVTTTEVSNITSTTASSGGDVTSDGGAEVTARGVCWSTSPNPTIADSYTMDGTGTGTFTSSITGLTPETTYHVRAYATNSVGTSYGNDIMFTTPESLTISGRVTTPEGEGVVDVTLTFSNSVGSTKTDSDGYYSQGVPYGWSGTVTPSKTGYTFDPFQKTYEFVTSNISDEDYTGTTTLPVISGRVKTPDDVGINEVTLTFSNDGGNATTNSSGFYRHEVNSGWTGTVTPSKSGYTFDPPYQDYPEPVYENKPNQDYTATTDLPLISGKVKKPDGTGISGITMTFSSSTGETTTETTGSNGDYRHAVNFNWSGTVTPPTPSKTGYTFKPPSREYTNVTTDLPDQDYTAFEILPVKVISGRVTYSSDTIGIAGLPDVTMTFTSNTDETETTTTGPNGNYSHEVKKGWSGTLTPSKTGHYFSPYSQSYENVTFDRPSQDFKAYSGSIALHLQASREVESKLLIRKEYGKIDLTVNLEGSPPISRYVICRIEPNGFKEAIKEIPAAELQSGETYTYYDWDIEENITYIYIAEAQDSDGNVIGASNEKPI